MIPNNIHYHQNFAYMRAWASTSVYVFSVHSALYPVQRLWKKILFCSWHNIIGWRSGREFNILAVVPVVQVHVCTVVCKNRKKCVLYNLQLQWKVCIHLMQFDIDIHTYHMHTRVACVISKSQSIIDIISAINSSHVIPDSRNQLLNLAVTKPGMHFVVVD